MVTSTISVGEVLPFNILRLITVVGIIVTDAVFNTKNVIIEREATSLLLFNLFSSLIAFKPKGVAAFPNPNIFMTIFEDIYPIEGSPSGISGNIILTTLDNFFYIISSNPEVAAIFIVPNHKHISGTKLSIISIPLLPDVRRLFATLLFPFNKPNITPIMINIPHK